MQRSVKYETLDVVFHVGDIQPSFVDVDKKHDVSFYRISSGLKW